jgi:hypothetical protein
MRGTNGPVMVDRWKNDLQCTRHTLGDRLAGQREERPGFLTPHHERRPGAWPVIPFLGIGLSPRLVSPRFEANTIITYEVQRNAPAGLSTPCDML